MTEEQLKLVTELLRSHDDRINELTAAIRDITQLATLIDQRLTALERRPT